MRLAQSIATDSAISAASSRHDSDLGSFDTQNRSVLQMQRAPSAQLIAKINSISASAEDRGQDKDNVGSEKDNDDARGKREANY
jgi:hypothetical protein